MTLALTPRTLVEFTGDLLAVGQLQWAGTERLLYRVHDPRASAPDAIMCLIVASGRQDLIGQATQYHLAPDGRTIALVGPDGVAVVRITDAGQAPCGGFPLTGRPQGLQWSPDSRLLSYVVEEVQADGSWGPCLLVSDPATSAVVRRVELPGLPDGQAVWSPDGSAIAFAVERTVSDQPPAHQLWLYRWDADALTLLYEGPYGIGHLQWGADASLLYFVSTHGSVHGSGDITVNIHRCAVATAATAPLFTAWSAQDCPLAVCPRSGRLAFLRNTTGVFYPEFHELCILDPRSGEVARPAGRRQALGALRWAPTGDRLHLLLRDGGHFPLLAAVSADGTVERLTSEQDNPRAHAVSAAGQVAWLSRGTTDQWTLACRGPGDATGRTVMEWSQPIASSSLGRVENISWRSRDGLVVRGFLIHPVGHRPGTRCPLIVDIHGGPVLGFQVGLGALCCGSPLEWHMWAALGYAVLVPDYRTGIGDWDAFAGCRDRQDYAERECDDVLAGVDSVIAGGVADPARLALIGHSHGSKIVNFILTRTGRFAAAVSYEGFLGNTLGWAGGAHHANGSASDTWLFRGRPWEVPGHYRRNEWIHDAQRVTTPALLILGGRSASGGHAECRYLHAVLKTLGVPVELVVYPDEDHVVARRENREDLVRRVAGWIARFVPPG